MKYILILLTTMLFSCGKELKQLQYEGEITSLRIDDDAEYHFSTDFLTESDVQKYKVVIIRTSTFAPKLYRLYHKCEEGKTCMQANDNWEIDQLGYWQIELPNDYKIETFDD